MTKSYSLTNIAVLYLDAGNDRNGNPRRGYLLVDSTTGANVAYADEGYDGSRCLFDAVSQFSTNIGGPNYSEMVEALYVRRTERIRIAPSYRTRLLRDEANARIGAQIHGRPTLTA